jgi:polycystin 1L2
LNYIHIWHDNTGQGTSGSWFLKYIIVRDLQTMEKSYFICQRWLAVEKDDGQVSSIFVLDYSKLFSEQIERLLPIAGELQKQEFKYILSKQTYQNVSDGHLWFSIYSRPPSSQFTRVQRCTCCFVLLFTAMLLNIMYYDLSKESTTVDGLSLGPMYITREQVCEDFLYSF